ncbi:thiamine diphosphokinase [Ponticoccus sp. (in: a-proteobacteria)]|uniref:thiamine diphosphokinase n=1 Tax=Ponticoccus sp. (in: a-proteobacteria) TaxID=1925025 RepID=UPI003AB32613
MNDKIVESPETVVLVGGGACHLPALKAAMTGRVVVAADGGTEAVLAAGRTPDAVIGDMDSLRPEIRARIPAHVLYEISEQDSTDFDKGLRSIAAPLVLGHGFLGKRLDHQLAAMIVLVRRAAQRCVLVGAEDVVCLCPPRLALDLPAGERVSLFPMGPVRGRSEGLRWPIDGLDFAPGVQGGTSNEALGPVTLTLEAPLMLLILPVDCLDALLAGLEGAPGW